MLKLRHEAGDGADHFKVYIGQVRIGGPGRNDSRARTQPKLDTDRRNSHIWGWVSRCLGGRPWEFPNFRPWQFPYFRARH
jgi:hypothetical protein